MCISFMKISYETYEKMKKMMNRGNSVLEISIQLECSKDDVQEVVLSENFDGYIKSRELSKKKPKKNLSNSNPSIILRNAEILQMRKQGETLDAIGRKHNLTRERVRQVLFVIEDNLDLQQVKSVKNENIRKEFETEIRGLQNHIDSNWNDFQSKTIAEISQMLHVSEGKIKKSISRVQSLYLIRNQENAIQKTWTEKDCIDVLQLAATFSFPLTVLEYRKLVDSKTIVGPTLNIFISRFGSWMRACDAAGVETGDPQRLYNATWSNSELLLFVRRFMHASGPESWSIERYQVWRANQDPVAPSVGLIRLRLGTWTEIRILALELEAPDFDMNRYKFLESNEE